MISVPPPISRAEWIWLAVAMVIGAALRLGNLSEVAIEHFDEAAYASNLLFPADQGGEYPFRQLYAPPLLPAAIEWTTIFGQMLFGGVPSWWPMLPALIAGLATIPSAWWIVRQWFSPRAGIIAAILIASYEFHAAYCRTALTDVPLTLFILWAVHRFWIALQTGTTRDAVIAGAVTSLAWWTKYNGWLPLAIAASGGVLWQIVTPPAERNWARLAKVWLIAAATAAVLWLPVLWDCQKIGGYAAVAANHRRYVDGFAKWWPNLLRGIANLDEFVGPISAGSLMWLLAGWLFFRERNVIDGGTKQSQGRLALAMSTAWFWGLLVATPLYVPYARLWEPWFVASCLAVAGAYFLIKNSAPLIRDRLLHWCTTCAAILFGLTLMIGFNVIEKNYLSPPSCQESRSGALAVAKSISASISDRDAPIFVHSEPAVWFHLRQHGAAAVIADGLKYLEQPMRGSAYLVVGAQAERDPQFDTQFREFESRLELIGSFDWKPSRIVILDQHSPAELAAHPELRTQTVKLYRVRR